MSQCIANMTDSHIAGVTMLYFNTSMSLETIAKRCGVSQKQANWAIDETRRRRNLDQNTAKCEIESRPVREPIEADGS